MFKDEALKTVRSYQGMRRVAGNFGIELELEGRDLRMVRYPEGWIYHEEGSLRNGGVEVVSVPLKLEEVEEAVTAVDRAIGLAGAAVDPNAHRTSTHIHTNAQDKPFGDVFGLVTLFTAVEPLWFRLCGEKRDGNAFCLPSYDSGYMVTWLIDVFKTMERFKSDGFYWPELGKYAALGFNRYPDLGSIEFRCFPQTTNGVQVKDWCTWITNLWRIVEACEDKTFRTLLKQGIRDPHWLAGEVFGQTIFRSTISPGEMSELVQFGIRNSYEISRLLNKFYQRTVVEKKKKKLSVEDIINGGEQLVAAPQGVDDGWREAAVPNMNIFARPPRPIIGR